MTECYVNLNQMIPPHKTNRMDLDCASSRFSGANQSHPPEDDTMSQGLARRNKRRPRERQAGHTRRPHRLHVHLHHLLLIQATLLTHRGEGTEGGLFHEKSLGPCSHPLPGEVGHFTQTKS